MNDQAQPDAIALLTGQRAHVELPLILQDRVVGALSFYFEQPKRVFTASERAYLSRVQFVIASAVETQRLLEEQTLQARYAQALNRINEAVHSSLDFEQIMGPAIADATQSVGLHAATILFREDEGWRFHYSYGLEEDIDGRFVEELHAPMALRAFETHEVQVVDDISRAEIDGETVAMQLGIKAMMVVPLFVREQVLGVLYVANLTEPGPFRDEQVGFMTNVGYTLSLALENSRLYADEHRIAETLQQALLALPDQVGGIDFAHSYHSASEAASVGGDFYDVFELEHERVGLLIGDVAGKGLDAAVLTSLMKNTIRAHASEWATHPAKVLSLTNDIVYKLTSVESFATVFFAVMDRHDGTMRYSNAGHTTTLVRRWDGSVALLPANSPILGAFEATEFQQSTTRLGFDDTVLMYTDGVTEARQTSALYGEERLIQFVHAQSDNDPAGLVKRLIEDVRFYAGGRLNDDVAVLVVKRIANEPGVPTQETLPLFEQ